MGTDPLCGTNNFIAREGQRLPADCFIRFRSGSQSETRYSATYRHCEGAGLTPRRSSPKKKSL